MDIAQTDDLKRAHYLSVSTIDNRILGIIRVSKFPYWHLSLSVSRDSFFWKWEECFEFGISPILSFILRTVNGNENDIRCYCCCRFVAFN